MAIPRFEVIGDLTDIEAIATGRGIRELARLQNRYGRRRPEPPIAQSHPPESTGDPLITKGR
jgi:hypothetical protein